METIKFMEWELDSEQAEIARNALIKAGIFPEPLDVNDARDNIDYITLMTNGDNVIELSEMLPDSYSKSVEGEIFKFNVSVEQYEVLLENSTFRNFYAMPTLFA